MIACACRNVEKRGHQCQAYQAHPDWYMGKISEARCAVRDAHKAWGDSVRKYRRIIETEGNDPAAMHFREHCTPLHEIMSSWESDYRCLVYPVPRKVFVIVILLQVKLLPAHLMKEVYMCL
jgi:hypothetical protein